MKVDIINKSNTVDQAIQSLIVFHDHDLMSKLNYDDILDIFRNQKRSDRLFVTLSLMSFYDLSLGSKLSLTYECLRYGRLVSWIVSETHARVL